jgi:hypothetical protein
MPFPVGLPTKTLTFGRYSAALGSNSGGSVQVGFDKAMLHTPTGEVIVSGTETRTVDPATGQVSIVVPVTVTENLVADWWTASPITNQRLKITVNIPGYPPETKYADIDPGDPAVMDYDQLSLYASPGGLPVLRGEVTSWASLNGIISTAQVTTALVALGFLQSALEQVDALPSATSGLRGKMLLLRGGAGVADTFHVCMKNSSDAYVWVQV